MKKAYNKSMNKTNAIRFLDTNKIEYEVFEYPTNGPLDALSVAGYLNEDPNRVFKTLVTVASSKTNYVFVVPGNSELDLKKAAKAVNEKAIEMIPQKTLLPLTGYIHGGCSPIGMKKPFKTIIDDSAILYDKIYVSAGKIGMQIKISPDALAKLINAEYKEIRKNLSI